ncbi:MAG: Npun_F5749 family FMN-dependent PPOX-type flavoprotein [Cyanobacteria bacterium P01_C01_bin.89]
MTSLAPWRSPLSRALHRNRSLAYARYFQLATVRADGAPANRTVVFRGFSDRLDMSNSLKIITDHRSEKIAQCAGDQRAEACWYFPKTREQFRLLGTIATVTNQESSEEGGGRERVTTWQNLSDGARLQFAWPQPGDRRAEDENAFTPEPPNPKAPPETFVLLYLIVKQVDWLNLRGDPQDRIIYHQNADGWEEQSVNP